MARISLGISLLLVVASSVIYEAQGTFLLKHYLRKKFPAKSSEFTPYANKGILLLVTNLEGGCPATTEFKTFFAKFKDYMTFIETSQATSKNIDVEMKTKADGLFSAMSSLSGQSADAGSFQSTMLSMGKTLVEQKKNTQVMTNAQKKELIVSMVKWCRMVASFVKTASEKKGKSINISSYGLDVDVNDKSIGGGSSSSKTSFSSESQHSSTTAKGSSSTKFESITSANEGAAAAGGNENTGKIQNASSDKKDGSDKNTASKKQESRGAKKEDKNTSTKTKESAKPESGKSFKDTTGGGSPTGSPSNSKPASEKTFTKSNAGAKTKTSSSATSVKQVESETSKEVMTFITGLEKKYSEKSELKVFFEKLKASMTACSTISSKTATDYDSTARSATGKLADAMKFVGASKSAKMKSNMETNQDKLLKTLKELQDINSKIVNEKQVTSTQQTELKQTITMWEQVTTQFVETAASSSSSSSSSQSQENSVRTVKKD